MIHSQSLTNIAKAMHAAQGQIKGAVKDAQNPFFKSKYADLESCWDAAREALQANGLSVLQTMGFNEKAGPTLITTLLHVSGEYIWGEQPLCAKGDNPQELGSAISYARRYGLAAILGIIQVDDDGAAASNKTDASTDPGDFKITVGQHAGKRIREIQDLGGWVGFHSQNKKLNGPMLDAVNAAQRFLDSRK